MFINYQQKPNLSTSFIQLFENHAVISNMESINAISNKFVFIARVVKHFGTIGRTWDISL
jgi:hypothetical protein